MRNILILIEHLNGGGAERVAAELSLALETKGYNVSLITFEDRGTSYKHCNNCISLDLPGSSNYLKKLFNLFKRINKIRRIKKEKNVEATISFIENANLINVLTKGNDRIICSIRTVLSNVIKKSIARRIHTEILKRADSVVTLSEFVRKDLINIFKIPPEKITTIYNPCNLPIHTVEEEKHNDVFTIISAGRFVIAKGQWHLVRSFSNFHNQYPNTKLKMMGEGPLEEELRTLVIKLGLANDVEFLGFVNSPENELLNADIFVFTSLWEGFGNAIIEAMACGLPVVCSDCPGGPHEIICGNEEVIKNEEGFGIAKYGILYRAFDVDDYIINEAKPLNESEKSLVNAMEKIYIDKQLRKRMVRRSLERAGSFNPDTIISNWEQTINGM